MNSVMMLMTLRTNFSKSSGSFVESSSFLLELQHCSIDQAVVFLSCLVEEAPAGRTVVLSLQGLMGNPPPHAHAHTADVFPPVCAW